MPGGIRCRAPRSRRVEAQARDDAGQPGAEHRQGLRLVGDPLKLIEFLPGAQPRLLNQVGRTAVGPVRAGLLPRERFEPGSDAREQFLRGGVVAGAGTGEQVSEAGDVVHVGRLYAVRDCDARAIFRLLQGVLKRHAGLVDRATSTVSVGDAKLTLGS